MKLKRVTIGAINYPNLAIETYVDPHLSDEEAIFLSGAALVHTGGPEDCNLLLDRAPLVFNFEEVFVDDK